MTPTERLQWIRDHIDNGRTIVIATAFRAIEIAPKTWARWEKSGAPLFKATAKSLYIARGKSWDCIDYCQITAH